MVAHKIRSELILLHFFWSQVVKFGSSNSRAGNGFNMRLNFEGRLVSFVSQFAYLAQRKYPRHIRDIAGKSAPHIHHHRATGFNNGTIGADGHRFMGPGTSHGEIVRWCIAGIVAGKYTSHKQFHGLPENPEMTGGSFTAKQTLNFDGEVEVGHARPV